MLDTLELYVCETCSIAFYEKAEFEQHLVSHNELNQTVHVHASQATANANDFSEVIFENTDLDSSINPLAAGPLKCDACSEMCVGISGLLTHVCASIPQQITTYKCEKCSQEFAENAELQEHMKSHILMESFKCGTCDATFANQRSLKIHEKSHVQISLFKCRVCKKLFSELSDLTEHELCHRHEEQRFICKICSESFISINSFLIHQQVHVTGPVAAHSCDSCSQTFSKKALLAEHQKSHVEESCTCSVCGKKFVKRSHLVRHMMCHNKEKIYSCEMCDESFAFKSHLYEHLNKHSKVKAKLRYQCQICSDSFQLKAQLIHHLQTHSQEEV